ncbi:hypothetical protein IMSAG049_00784 [Clostridiales bacterium]|nr:hypothetical protein IMSAG049_00784 [Clostridiales bacterium]
MLIYWGFSPIGLLFRTMLFIPNLLWTSNKPNGYSSKNESRILLIFERVGEVLVTFTALTFRDLNTGSIIWLVLATVCMVLYELWWLRYFRSKKELSDFYSSFIFPVPGALLPVLAFLFSGIYKKSVFMFIAGIILGIGHIGIHMQHLRELKG